MHQFKTISFRTRNILYFVLPSDYAFFHGKALIRKTYEYKLKLQPKYCFFYKKNHYCTFFWKLYEINKIILIDILKNAKSIKLGALTLEQLQSYWVIWGFIKISIIALKGYYAFFLPAHLLDCLGFQKRYLESIFIKAFQNYILPKFAIKKLSAFVVFSVSFLY